jgi:hypothetical protein
LSVSEGGATGTALDGQDARIVEYEPGDLTVIGGRGSA